MLGEKHLRFLATKVVPPRCQGLIERPRLLALTTQLSEKRLAVVKAPAGFGKTSLAATWLQRLQQEENALAWFDIDSEDDEPQAFLFYVAQALQRARDKVGAAANITTAQATAREILLRCGCRPSASKRHV
jgi:LuxR family maltose regulon positive regulatory protein